MGAGVSTVQWLLTVNQIVVGRASMYSSPGRMWSPLCSRVRRMLACSDASPHASTYSRSPPLHARIPSSRVCSWAIGLREFRQNSWGSCLCSSLCRCRSARASAGTSACAWCRLGQQAPTGLGWAAGAAACMRPPAFCLTVPRGTLAR